MQKQDKAGGYFNSRRKTDKWNRAGAGEFVGLSQRKRIGEKLPSREPCQHADQEKNAAPAASAASTIGWEMIFLKTSKLSPT